MNGAFVIRKCLIFALVAGLIPSVASAEDDDFLSDAVVESEEEKKPKKPLFLIPLQPVWKTIEPAKIDDAVKNIASELGDSAGFAVEQYNPRLGSAPFDDPEPRLKKRWEKEIRVAENNTRKRRFSQAIKSAGRVVRQVMQNPEYLRDARPYCRSMILVAEGELRRGRRNKTMSIEEVAARKLESIEKEVAEKIRSMDQLDDKLNASVERALEEGALGQR